MDLAPPNGYAPITDPSTTRLEKNKGMYKLLSLIGGLSLLLCCGSCTQESERPGRIGGEVDRTDWVLYAMEEKGKPVKLPKAFKVSLNFVDNHISGEVVCNQYGTDYVADGNRLLFDRIFFTERYCGPEANLEVNYLKHLNNAANYGVKDGVLCIYCSDDAVLVYRRNQPDQQNATPGLATESINLPSLLAYFTPWPAQDPYHCFSIISGDNIESYPFLGRPLPGEMFPFFDPSSKDAFTQAQSVGTYVVGVMDSLYFVRMMGQSMANNIAIYRLKNKTLRFQMLLARANCDDKGCTQQDGWLTDLNRDGRMDVVTRNTEETLDGQRTANLLKAFLRNPDGSFSSAPEVKLDEAKYPMAKLR